MNLKFVVIVPGMFLNLFIYFILELEKHQSLYSRVNLS